MRNESEITVKVKPVLEGLLDSVPFIDRLKLLIAPEIEGGRRADFIAAIGIGNQDLKLVGEVKRNLQPRYVLDAVRQVKDHCSYVIDMPAFPVVVSEYISPRSAEILIDENVSYFDLVGNCRLSFAHVYIEKEGKKSKSQERRGIKSLFGLKSSRMLRLMLNHPVRPWQVKELAEKTELSLGQVSNIRRALLDQNYAIEAEEGGISIYQPNALLNEWQSVYKKNIVSRASGFYSLLNTEERLAAIKEAMLQTKGKNAEIILSGLSAARWQAPFAKSISEHFYADTGGMKILKQQLMLEEVKEGPNVIVEEPKDAFIFKEATECAPGLKCTSPIQTYLDLYITGEREQEAAEHLKSCLLKENWNQRFKGETWKRKY